VFKIEGWCFRVCWSPYSRNSKCIRNSDWLYQSWTVFG